VQLSLVFRFVLSYSLFVLVCPGNSPTLLSTSSPQARPSFFRKKDRSSFDDASTVQLATPDSCLVVHLVRGCSGRHSQVCAPVLKAVLCDEQYVKAGCALDDDMMALYEVWGGLKAKSRLDLGFIGTGSSGQKNNNNKRRSGLKTLSRAVIGVDLPKPKKISMSDWSSVPLTEKQIIYSARDAWAGAAIVNKLAEYDSDTFGHEALVRSLQHSETPISKLVDR
jgi:ribonuclease D